MNIKNKKTILLLTIYLLISPIIHSHPKQLPEKPSLLERIVKKIFKFEKQHPIFFRLGASVSTSALFKLLDKLFLKHYGEKQISKIRTMEIPIYLLILIIIWKKYLKHPFFPRRSSPPPPPPPGSNEAVLEMLYKISEWNNSKKEDDKDEESILDGFLFSEIVKAPVS